MSGKISRRQVLNGALLGGATVGIAAAWRRFPLPVRDVYDLADALNYSLHDLLLSDMPLVREYALTDVARDFPTSGTTTPRDESYQRMKANNFADWNLTVDGKVSNPLSLSLAQLQSMKSQSQITLHTCDEGWSAIGEWTGVPLSHLLNLASVRPDARYVVFHCMDTMGDGNRYYESIDLFAANHPQTILAYGLNGSPVPEANGAPLRLRIETQIGYKHAKYVERVELVDSLVGVGAGRGGWWEDADRAVWYAGL